METKAKVTFTCELSLPSRWGADCTLEQVFKQARDEAVAEVSKRFGGLCVIIGVPYVAAITTERGIPALRT